MIICATDPEAYKAKKAAERAICYSGKMPGCWNTDAPWPPVPGMYWSETIQSWPPVYILQNHYKKQEFRGIEPAKPKNWPSDHHWPPILDGIIIEKFIHKGNDAFLMDNGYCHTSGLAPFKR